MHAAALSCQVKRCRPQTAPRSRGTLFHLHSCILAAHSYHVLTVSIHGRLSRRFPRHSSALGYLQSPAQYSNAGANGDCPNRSQRLVDRIHHSITPHLQAHGPSFVAISLVGSSFLPFSSDLGIFLLERHPLCHTFVAASHSPSSCHPPTSNYTLGNSPSSLLPPASHKPSSASRTAVRHRCRQGRVSHAVPGQALEPGQLES